MAGRTPRLGVTLATVGLLSAGTHEVTPVSSVGKATVRIPDPSGAVLFEHTVDTHPVEGGGQEVPRRTRGRSASRQVSTSSSASSTTAPAPFLPTDAVRRPW